MANEVVPFEQAQLPAYAQEMNEASNIEPRMSLPTLSLRGKVWRLIKNGEENVIAHRDPTTNEMVPRQIMEFVVVEQQKRRSRAYFEGPYEEGKSQQPTCWSSDSVRPDENVPEEQKQCETCAKCPQAVKGAKVTEQGKKVAACSMFKRLAVVPPNKKFVIGPLLLKLPITSLWDKDADAEAANGWYAWDQYSEFLLNRGAKYTGIVVTAAKFDQSAAYPKVMFKAVRFITPDEAPIIQQLRDDPITKQICFGEIPDAYDASKEEHEAGQVESEEAEAAPATTAAPAAPQKPASAPPPPAPPKPPAKPRQAKGSAPTKAPAAAPQQPAKPAATAAPAAPAKGLTSLDDDDGPPLAAPAGQPQPDGGAAGEDLDSIIEGWDGE